MRETVEVLQSLARILQPVGHIRTCAFRIVSGGLQFYPPESLTTNVVAKREDVSLWKNGHNRMLRLIVPNSAMTSNDKGRGEVRNVHALQIVASDLCWSMELMKKKPSRGSNNT